MFCKQKVKQVHVKTKTANIVIGINIFTFLIVTKNIIYNNLIFHYFSQHFRKFLLCNNYMNSFDLLLFTNIYCKYCVKYDSLKFLPPSPTTSTCSNCSLKKPPTTPPLPLHCYVGGWPSTERLSCYPLT